MFGTPAISFTVVINLLLFILFKNHVYSFLPEYISPAIHTTKITIEIILSTTLDFFFSLLCALRRKYSKNI